MTAKPVPEVADEPVRLPVAGEELSGNLPEPAPFRSRIIDHLNHIRIIGFQGVGLVDVLRFFFEGLQNRSFALYAAAMGYRFMFALFPGLIFMLTLLPYIPVPGLQDQVLDYLGRFVPGQAMKLVDGVIGEVFHESRVGLLSVNLVIMLVSALGGIRAMMFAFSRKDENIFKRRNFLQVNGMALFIFLVLIALFILILSVWIYGDVLLDGWQHRQVVTSTIILFVLRVFHFLILILLFFTGISFVYYYAPETHIKLPFFSPGSILATTLSLIAIWFLKLLLAGVVNFSKVYGSLSAIMVLMFWFYWLSIVLLIGFEMNLAIKMAKVKHKPPVKDS